MEFNRIINGDCDVVMAEMIKEGIHFDLICTDPPYNLNKDFGNDSDKLELNDFLAITEKRINICRDLLTPNGSIVWFGIHHYRIQGRTHSVPTPARPAEWRPEYPLETQKERQ